MSMTAAERKQLILENQEKIRQIEQQIQVARPIDELVHTMEKQSHAPLAKPLQIKIHKILGGHYGKIYAMDWGKDDTQLISAAQDGSIILWNAFNGHKLDVINLRSTWVMSCAMSDSGRMTASGGLDNVVTIYKIPEEGMGADHKHDKELHGHEGYISGAVFLDDSQVVSCSGDGRVIHWDIESSKAVKTLSEAGSHDVMDVDKLPNSGGNLIAAGSLDYKVRIWDLRLDAKEKPMSFPGHEGDVNAVCAMPNGYSFVSGGDDCGMIMFDTRSYGPLQEFRHAHVRSGISAVACSGSGRFLFAGYDDTYIRCWDTHTGGMAQEVQLNNNHTNRVSCLGVNSTGTALCTGSWDFHLKVWG